MKMVKKNRKSEGHELETRKAGLIPWLRPMESFEKAMEKFFRIPLDFGFETIDDTKITESGGSYTVTAKIPDFKRDDIKIDVEEDMVMVQGSFMHEEGDRKKGEEIFESETFYREIPLPGPVIAKGAKASFKNGVLHLTLKKDESAGARFGRVTIH